MKNLTSQSILVLPFISAQVALFASTVGKDFTSYYAPSSSKLAIAHFKGSEINGIATVDFSSDANGKSSTITFYDNGLSYDQKASMLKFALLKSITFGCTSSTVLSIGSVDKFIDSFDTHSFGTFAKDAKSISFGNLPKADAGIVALYASAGYLSGISALSGFFAQSFFDSLSAFGQGLAGTPSYAFCYSSAPGSSSK